MFGQYPGLSVWIVRGIVFLRGEDMTKIRLKTGTPQDVRRTLTRVINLVANGEMDSKTGNTIILGCNAVLSAIRTDEQQRKIEELERVLNEVIESNERR